MKLRIEKKDDMLHIELHNDAAKKPLAMKIRPDAIDGLIQALVMAARTEKLTLTLEL